MNLPHNICIGLGAGVSGMCIGMAIFGRVRLQTQLLEKPIN
ncbi:hypothetical protein [Nostoc sp. KVJ3]|nr:hypothetical protein [Nostoc sp. KVJ3]